MRRFLTLAAALLAFAALTAPASAQFLPGMQFVGPAGGYSSTADKDVALYVKYVGSTAGKPTVEVASNGDITFKIAGSVDTTVGCPTIGTGIIDVSDSACDTFGEIVNKIAGQSSNWLVVLNAALATDTANDSLATLSATDTNIRTKGVPLYYDTNFAGSSPVVTIVFGPPSLEAEDGSWYFSGDKVNPNPFGSLFTLVAGFTEKQTSTGTIADTVLYGVRGIWQGVFGSTASYSETVRTIWSQTGGATTVQATGPTSAAVPIISAPGEKLVLRIGSSTDITAQSLVGAGYFARAQQ